jgi:broad specificity phosphatase PhoE
MKIYFARHGESLANTRHIISNRSRPHPLTALGRAQAAALAARLAGQRISRVFSSPVPRASETAEIIAKTLGAPREITEALREYDCGSLEGRGDAAAWATHRQFWNDWLAGRNRDQAPPSGETYTDLCRRFAPFFAGLIRQFGQTEACFMCIGHGGIYTFGLPHLLRNVDFAFIQQHGLTHTTLITTESRENELFCTGWEDCAAMI